MRDTNSAVVPPKSMPVSYHALLRLGEAAKSVFTHYYANIIKSRLTAQEQECQTERNHRRDKRYDRKAVERIRL